MVAQHGPNMNMNIPPAFFYPVRNKGWRRMSVHTSLRRTAVFSAMFIQGKGQAVNDEMDVNATHFLKMQ